MQHDLILTKKWHNTEGRLQGIHFEMFQLENMNLSCGGMSGTKNKLYFLTVSSFSMKHLKKFSCVLICF